MLRWEHLLPLASESSPENPLWADFVATSGSDVIGTEDKPELMQDTRFRRMSGNGNQDFLAFFHNTLVKTGVRHLEAGLAGPRSVAYSASAPSLCRFGPASGEVLR